MIYTLIYYSYYSAHAQTPASVFPAIQNGQNRARVVQRRNSKLGTGALVTVL